MKILVVRTDFLGDAILTNAAIEALSLNYPQAQIDILATQYNQPAFLYNPHLRNKCFLTHRADNKLRATNLNELHKLTENYDLAFVFNRDLRNFYYLSQLKIKQIYALRLGRKSFKANFFCLIANLLPKYHFLAYNQKQHEVLNLIDLIRMANTQQNLLAPARARFYLADNLITTPQANLIALNISGRIGSNRYLNDAMAVALIQLLNKQFNYYLICTREDLKRAQQITAACSDMNIEIICSPDIFAIAKAISRCHYFIGADGGLLHLAAGLVTKPIGIFHQQNTATWHPWSESFITIQAPTHNIYDVSVFEIVQNIRA